MDNIFPWLKIQKVKCKNVSPLPPLVLSHPTPPPRFLSPEAVTVTSPCIVLPTAGLLLSLKMVGFSYVPCVFSYCIIDKLSQINI